MSGVTNAVNPKLSNVKQSPAITTVGIMYMHVT